MERVDQQRAVADEGVQSSRAGGAAGLKPIAALEERHLALPLEDLAQKARAGGEAEQAALDRALETLLPTEANGRALLKVLDEGVLADLPSSRALGVEALLRLGYPWAVHIQAEELEWYRATQSAAARRRWLILLSSFAVAAGSALYLLRFFT